MKCTASGPGGDASRVLMSLYAGRGYPPGKDGHLLASGGQDREPHFKVGSTESRNSAPVILGKAQGAEFLIGF